MIIVDLDDTVLDTRGSLRLVKLEEAARLAPRTRDVLLARAREHRSGRALIGDACAAFDVDEETEALMVAAYYENHPADFVVPLIEGAREALESWRERGVRIVCVTAGDEGQQRAKIENANLDFDEVIVVSEPQDKALVYDRIMEDPHRTVVIGDKLSDVRPALDLGARAILFAAPIDAWDGPCTTSWREVCRIVDELFIEA